MPIRERYSNSKLTPEKEAAIINELAYTTKSMTQIAKDYGISIALVGKVNRKYDHPGPDPLGGSGDA